MEKIVKFSPAFDRRHKDPSKNYGVHGVELRMVLKGEHGAVQFVVFTNWQLPHVTEEFFKSPMRNKMDIKVRFLPFPADVGYHSKKPMYNGQEIMQENCPYTDGICYYDGSSTRAEEFFNILVMKGSDAIWEELEKMYVEQFGELV